MNYEEKLREIINSNSEYYPSEDKAVFAKYFPELKKPEDERIRKGLIKAVSRTFEGNKLFDTDVTREEALAWLEKQGEKKPTDKAEPKFKVGDWITNGDYTWKIVGAKPLDYILQSQDGNIVDDTISYVDERFHSFTIEDEKKELKKIEPKKLDADKVIEWLKITINKRAENYGVYKETRLILPYNSIEDLINDFKEDFGL